MDAEGSGKGVEEVKRANERLGELKRAKERRNEQASKRTGNRVRCTLPQRTREKK